MRKVRKIYIEEGEISKIVRDTDRRHRNDIYQTERYRRYNF